MALACLVTSVPVIPHGYANVRCAQRRGVVHAVAGHSHYMPAAGERPHDRDLVLGTDPGEHSDGVYPAGELISGHRVQVSVDAQLAGDRYRRIPMVTSDHLAGDAGPMRQLDRVAGLRARRVGDPDQPEQRQTCQLSGQPLVGAQVVRASWAAALRSGATGAFPGTTSSSSTALSSGTVAPASTRRPPAASRVTSAI